MTAPDQDRDFLVICPRCGYDQAGEVARWDAAGQCPVQGLCPECGARFAWRELWPVAGAIAPFDAERPLPDAPRLGLWATLLRVVRPGMLQRLHAPGVGPRWWRTAAMVPASLIAAHLLAGVRKLFEATQLESLADMVMNDPIGMGRVMIWPWGESVIHITRGPQFLYIMVFQSQVMVLIGLLVLLATTAAAGLVMAAMGRRDRGWLGRWARGVVWSLPVTLVLPWAVLTGLALAGSIAALLVGAKALSVMEFTPVMVLAGMLLWPFAVIWWMRYAHAARLGGTTAQWARANVLCTLAAFIAGAVILR